MGKSKKGHNWKARQQKPTKIDRTEEKKLEDKIEIEGVDKSQYDDCNPLVFTKKKRKLESKAKSVRDTKIVKRLSRKKRKLLEKVLERRERNTRHASLIESLQSVQATPEELALMISTRDVHSGIHNKKIKKADQSCSTSTKINTISGTRKRKSQPEQQEEEISSSSSEEESSEEEEEQYAESVATQEGKEPEDTEPVSTEVTTVEEPCKEKASVAKDGSKKKRKSATFIAVDRLQEIQDQRLLLPITGEEQVIMETISDNPVVILCGETGSGKTTQVPQFLYEAGYAHQDGKLIAVTQPRRVAAISMSYRVATELNLSQDVVSYQIRYEGNCTPDTKIKFMTDGVLLKEVQQDFLLTKYSVVIIDEAHERSVYTDVLIGLLSRIVPLRNKKESPLKLIIMSATLRVEDFTENSRLFKIIPPVIKVDARQYPVTVHFSRKTPDDYLAEAYRKICKIHQELPEGGILVFVTGQQEVHSLCAKLKKRFPAQINEKEVYKTKGKSKRKRTESVSKLPKFSLDEFSTLPMDEDADGEDQADSEAELSDDLGEHDEVDEDGVSVSSKDYQPMYVLPLYSLLSTARQTKVFQPPPEGCRLCVVATNVAETSLTIPGVKYVVDTGKTKTRFYDKVTGVSTFKVTWTSKASANQRSGRAGRTSPGHSYRLYSSALFNDEFDNFSLPEIVRRPVDDLILQMKDMSIDKIVNFPFPTPPDADALKAAEKLLVSLGALEKPIQKLRMKDKQPEESGPITALGRAMACFPVSPRYGKMLSLGHQHDLLPYVVAIVAALSVQEPFLENESVSTALTEDQQKTERKQQRFKILQTKRNWAGTGHSLLLGDLMVLLKAVGACEYAGCTQQFCAEHSLRYKAMTEIRKLRKQLTDAVNGVLPEANLTLDPKLPPPSDLQAKLLRQIVLAGLSDHVAKKLPDPVQSTEEAKKLKHAYQCMLLEDPVFVHPASVLFKQNAQYVVYQHVEETSKLYMKGVVAIEGEWLPSFIPNQCSLSKPLEDPSPRYCPKKGRVLGHMNSTCGGHYWPLPLVELDYPAGLDRYKWFARFLLEGQVCPDLQKFTSVLFTAPVTMVRSWASLQPRTEVLLKTLVHKEVDCKEKLKQAWNTDPKYLLHTYCGWLPEALHKEVKAFWPPAIK